MEIENPPTLNLCLKCRRRLLTCVCHLLRPFDTRTRFILLMHPMEFKKERTGTGRFGHLILNNSKILVGTRFDENPEFIDAIQDPNYESLILYPGDKTLKSEEASDWIKDIPRPLQIFLIDGTWPCAKKMMKETKLLHGLRRLSFSTHKVSKFTIKHQPLPGCLSTVESIYQVLQDFQQAGIEDIGQNAENLMHVFDWSVKQQIQLASDPTRAGYRRKPYSPPSERKNSLKWSKRLVFFRTSDE